MKNFFLLNSLNVVLVAAALLGVAGAANAQSPFTVVPATNASWNGDTKTLTISGNASIANVAPEQVIARVVVNENVTTLTLNGVDFASEDVAEGDNKALYYLATSGTLTITTEGINTIVAGAAGSKNLSVGISAHSGTRTSGNLHFEGTGTLNVSSSTAVNSYGIYLFYGSTTINSGTVNCRAGVGVGYHSFGIGSYNGNITINGGTVTVTASEAAKNSYGMVTICGSIILNGGSGTVRSTATYGKTMKAFSKNPVGTLAPLVWDAKEAAWGVPANGSHSMASPWRCLRSLVGSVYYQ